MRTVNPAVHARQRDKILSTACSLFARKGFTETSMDAIAAACRMKKPSLYHYFDSKQAVLRELVRQHIKDRPQHARDYHVCGDTEGTLVSIGNEVMRSMQVKSNRDFVAFMFRNAPSDPFVRKVFMESISDIISQAGQAMWKGQLSESKARTQMMFIHQFMGCLMRYVLETKIWKLGFAKHFKDKEYVASLAKTFSKGLPKDFCAHIKPLKHGGVS
jgi:AcrR family transcriptional regulator